MRKYLLLFVILATFNSCNDSDCDLYSTGPPITYVELVDSDTGENIFTSGDYQYTDIDVVNAEGEDVTSDFITENNYNIIRFIPYTYSSSNVIFIKVEDNINEDDINVKITFDIKKVETECYTNYYIENLEVENYPSETDANTGLLTIKV